jgi:hypothetical protein
MLYRNIFGTIIIFPIKEIRKFVLCFCINLPKYFLFWIFLKIKVYNMGRTVPSFRPALEHEIESWKDFKRALRPEEQKIFDKLMNFARIHADAGSMSARPMLSELLFISFAVEQEKKIEILEEKVKKLEELIKE